MSKRLSWWRLCLGVLSAVVMVLGMQIATFAVTEITIMSDSESPMNTLIRQSLENVYEKENPDIKVNWISVPSNETLQKQALEFASESDTFDVFSIFARNYGAFAAQGNLFPLDEFAKGDPQFDISTIVPNIVHMWDGKIVGWPLEPTVGLIQVYNKAMLADAGLDRPPVNWGEVLIWQKKLYNPPDSYGLILDVEDYMIPYHGFQPILYYNLGEEFDNGFAPAEIRFTSDKGIRAVETLKELATGYPDGWPTLQQMDTINMFMQGRLAMRYQFDWIYAEMIDPSKSVVADDVGLAPFPGPSVAGAWNLSINPYSKNKEAAFKVIKWVTSAEQQKWRSLNGSDATPTIMAVRADPEVLKVQPAMVATQGAALYPFPSFDGVADYLATLGRQVTLAVMGEISAEEALETTAAVVEKYLIK